MQTSDIAATSHVASSATNSGNVNAADTSDFNTFLTLLTAQMRNQDPLKPMESTEFVAQLASFSSVEQQIETNTKLAELLGAISNRSSDNLADWLGKEVLREGLVDFSGQPVEIYVPNNSEADAAQLVVRNSSKEIVYSQQIDPSAQTVFWDGTTLNSADAPFGQYGFDVESYSGDALLGREPGSVFDLVTEVRFDHENPVLVFGDGGRLNIESATAVRIPR